LSKNQRPLPQPLRFRQRRSGNLPRPVQLVNNFFFRTPKFFFGARRKDFSPAQKRELIPTPSRCQPLSSTFFKKPLPCCHSDDTTTAGCFQHAAEAFAYPASDPALCQPFFEFFSKTFSSQYPTFLFYCTMRICVFRDDTHEKSPERGLPGPSHQFA